MGRHRYLLQIVSLMFCVHMFAVAVNAEIKYKEVRANRGEKCIVCGANLTDQDLALIVKGRRVPLDSADVKKFLENQDEYFAALQPRGALFAEATDASEGAGLGGVPSGWFIFGTYVLVGLIFGGLSSYTAIGKGFAPIPFFILGLVFSIAGYAYIWSKPGKTKAGDIPSGLVKVPSTSSPAFCEQCGSPNHPSAKQCNVCRATLSPKQESEVTRVH